MVKQGDIIRLNFNPQAGHEQAGRRPAMVCPITRTNKSLPLHIRLDDRTQTTGVVLCDQAKIMDIKARDFEFIEKAPRDIVLEIVDIVKSFIEIED